MKWMMSHRFDEEALPGGLWVFQMLPDVMPEPYPPLLGLEVA